MRGMAAFMLMGLAGLGLDGPLGPPGSLGPRLHGRRRDHRSAADTPEGQRRIQKAAEKRRKKAEKARAKPGGA